MYIFLHRDECHRLARTTSLFPRLIPSHAEISYHATQIGKKSFFPTALFPLCLFLRPHLDRPSQSAYLVVHISLTNDELLHCARSCHGGERKKKYKVGPPRYRVFPSGKNITGARGKNESGLECFGK